MAEKSGKLDFKNIKTYVTNVQIEGVEVSNEEYIKKNIGAEIFKSKNFDEIINHTDKIRKSLYKLGCFKTVEALIDSANGNYFSNFKIKIIRRIFYDRL
jgi:hypothetical protein